MPPRPARKRKRLRGDTFLFFAVLLVLVVGFGFIAMYQNGLLSKPANERQADQGEATDQKRKDEVASVAPPETQQTESVDVPQVDLLSQTILLNGSESNRTLYDSLSDSERDSLQRMAEAIDVTLQGRFYRGALSDADLEVAERHSTLIDPVRHQEYWFRTAVKTPGFARFQRLRDRGDADELKLATMAWARLNGFTRGVLLEALQAIAEGDEEQLTAHQETIAQYRFILGVEQPVTPLRAPRP